MATFPDYVGIRWTDLGDTPASIVRRTEMDKGVAKQRRIASDVIVQLSVTLHFRTVEDSKNFETWFYEETNGGVEWFAWLDPRTMEPVQARFVGGELGTLKPGANTWQFAERSAKIEYVKAAYQ